MNIYVSEIGGEFHVNFTGLETKEDVEMELWEGERLTHFFRFDSSHCSNPEVEVAAEVIETLTCLETTREVLEKLLTAVYRLGR